MENKRKSEPYGFKPFTFQECSITGNRENSHLHLSMVESPQAGNPIVCDDGGNLYAFGNGVSCLGGFVQGLLLCYNVGEARWIRIPYSNSQHPRTTHDHSIILHGNHILVFGGLSNTLSVCDLRSLKWKTIKTSGEAPKLTFGEAVLLDAETRTLYVTGGMESSPNYGKKCLMDVHKLDLKTFTWERLYTSAYSNDKEFDEPGVPAPRFHHGVAFFERKIYILGGEIPSWLFSLEEVPAFDVKKRTWELLETFVNDGGEGPGLRSYPGCIQFGEDVFITGGRQWYFDGLRDFWRLNLPTLTWTKFSNQLPIPLLSHASCVTNSGCLWISGGETWDGKQSEKTLKAWLKVPTLKEMCWEAVLYYNKNIGLMSRTELRKMGVPKEFSDRVHPSPPGGPESESISEHWINNSLA